jgi:hypothetical protein
LCGRRPFPMTQGRRITSNTSSYTKISHYIKDVNIYVDMCDLEKQEHGPIQLLSQEKERIYFGHDERRSCGWCNADDAYLSLRCGQPITPLYSPNTSCSRLMSVSDVGHSDSSASFRSPSPFSCTEAAPSPARQSAKTGSAPSQLSWLD